MTNHESTPGPVDDAVGRGWIDLAARAFGGRALVANDEFFAPKERLLEPQPAIFIADRYTDRGKWMDGWETRRRRTPGHDWCVIRLGLPGIVRAVVVDTAHFRGNHPARASLEAIEVPVDATVESLLASDDWRPLSPETELVGHSENALPVEELGRRTHVRLNIFPDGGVARLRIFGDVVPDWPRLLAQDEACGVLADVASIVRGSRIVSCSDAFFSRPIHLLMPADGASMADGWETRRRRGPGHDWAIIALGRPARLERAILDTRHFKGNHPAAAALVACRLADGEAIPDLADPRWTTLAGKTALGPDAEHALTLDRAGPVTHVRLDIFPDGGVSRLRLLGRAVPARPESP